MSVGARLRRLGETVIGSRTIRERDPRLNLALLSGTTAYFLIFSLIPTITAFVLFLSIVDDPASIKSTITAGISSLPSAKAEFIASLVDYVLQIETERRPLGAVVAMLLAIWGMTGMASALINSIELYTAARHDGSMWRSYWKEFRVAMLLLAAIAGSVAAVVLIDQAELLIASRFSHATTWLQLAMWSAFFLIISWLATAMYRAAGIRPGSRFGISVGGLTSAGQFSVGTFLFGY